MWVFFVFFSKLYLKAEIITCTLLISSYFSLSVFSPHVVKQGEKRTKEPSSCCFGHSSGKSLQPLPQFAVPILHSTALEATVGMSVLHFSLATASKNVSPISIKLLIGI